MSRTTHQFSQTKRAEIPRSSFDLSHGLKTTFNAGFLVPVLSLEVIPGDTINCKMALFGRLATPIKPILDNLYLETFFFFTPTRQLWENWQKFNGEQIDPSDSTDFVVPVLSEGGSSQLVEPQTMADYLGVPIGLNPGDININALPFRNYNAVYNFWFRDENLINSATVDIGDGPDQFNPGGRHRIRRRRKRRDYLTSCLPWPQKGPEVTVNLGGAADIRTAAAINESIGIYSDGEAAYHQMDTTPGFLSPDPATGNAEDNKMYADLGTATGITINELRESFQIQKLLERDARGGTRYPEILKSHFGVTDPSMLVHQRPMFLGGGSSRININPVQQTYPTDQQVDTPQGNLAAFGTVSANNHGFTQSFTEHGYVLGLVNVRADLTYQEGLERYWSRSTRYDFYWPALSHLGEQAVLNKEIYAQGTPADDNVFGYQERYNEYRFKQSQITGRFRSQASASLDVWHLAQDFSVLPSLNEAFIEDNPPIDRVVAVPEEPDMLLDAYFKIRAARPLPLYGTPGLIDHF